MSMTSDDGNATPSQDQDQEYVREARELELFSAERVHIRGLTMYRRIEIGPLVYEFDRQTGIRRIFLFQTRRREIEDESEDAALTGDSPDDE